MLKPALLPGDSLAALLISTKFRPPVAGRAMMRPRLIDLLEAAPAHGQQIAVIAAPAGSGKTTLLASWSEAAARPVAWITLEKAENDPARFLAYLFAAIDRVAPGVIEPVRKFTESDYPPPDEAILTAIVNALDAAGPLAIVLDDYHEIDDPDVHRFVEFLVDYLPAHVQLVIASRYEPGISLARPRARWRVLDINLDDLRFTHEETTGLISGVVGSDACAEDAQLLNDRTEGWPAGLALALSALQRRPDSGVSMAYIGSEQQALLFMANETLDCLPPRLRRFLLATSILDRLTIDACVAVSDEADAGALLDEAERTILFILPLDEDWNQRRYHALFAQALQARLAQEFPGEIPELHRRAAQWFASTGDDETALHHALRAPDYDLARSIIIRNAAALLARGEMRTLRAWVEALPEDQRDTEPGLCLPYAWALAQSGALEAAEAHIEHMVEWLERARAGDREAQAVIPDIEFTEGELASIRSRIAALRGDSTETIRWVRVAKKHFSEYDAPNRGGIMLNYGHALGGLGDLDGAAASFAEVAALGPSAGPLVAALGLRYQAGVEVARARLGSAARLYRKAYDVTVSRGYEDLPATGIIIEGQAELAYLRNELDDAERLGRDALARGMRGGEIKISVPSEVILARIAVAHGRFTDAFAAIDRASALSHWSSTIAWGARFALKNNDLEYARRWATESGFDGLDSVETRDEFEIVIYARVLDALGRADERDVLLSQVHERATRKGCVFSRIEIEMLQALALHAGGNSDAAVERLIPALAIAEDAGIVRMFLDEGPRLGPLLARVERSLEPEQRVPSIAFVARLRRSLAQERPDDEETDIASGGLIEPLTPREREVLQLIAEGRTNQAIANELFLSVGSVKTHSSHVYGKLGVRGRTEAIARARSLGMLG
jgi:LuxR family maltose regulon positive regulatory protein